VQTLAQEESCHNWARKQQVSNDFRHLCHDLAMIARGDCFAQHAQKLRQYLENQAYTLAFTRSAGQQGRDCFQYKAVGPMCRCLLPYEANG
jgi:hypothetical protein